MDAWNLLVFIMALVNAEDADQVTTRQINCGSTNPTYVAVGYQGRFATPNYPNYYGGGSNCVWVLTTSSNAVFAVTCEPFTVGCADYFVYSPTGDSSFTDVTRPICGNGVFRFNSTSNSIALKFQSSYGTRGGRFSCIAKAVTTQNSCDCGIKGQDRIVGGQLAGVTEWPWQTLIADISPSGGGYQYCGGTLISSSMVLTAAHCTRGRIAAHIAVAVGQYDSSVLSSTAQVRRVTQIITHPGFNSTTVDNDVALLKLESPVTFNNAVRPVCLPVRYANEQFDGQKAIITGWGATSHGGQSSEPLREAVVQVVSTSSCRLYPSIGHRITNNMICTYTEGKDGCQGDSGGPLNWFDPVTGRVYVIGISSFGIGCARPNIPGVYAKVTNYLGWIQQQAGFQCTV